MSSISIPKNVNKAFDHPRWQQAMIVEMQTLKHMGLSSTATWQKTVGC